MNNQNEMNVQETETKNQIMKFEKNPELLNVFKTVEVNEENPEIRYTTTYDDTKLFNALRGKSIPVKEVIGEEFEVIDIVITANDVLKDRNDENSGKENKPIVHFYTADGGHYSSLSNGIIRNTKALFEINKIPSIDNPIKIRFEEVSTPKGTAHTFVLV